MKIYLSSILLLLATFSARVQGQPPAISMKTTNEIGTTFSFYIEAKTTNTKIQLDWGNKSLVEYTIGTINTLIEGTLLRNIIKIYGTGIKSLRVGSKNLFILDVSNAPDISLLYCNSNQLSSLDLSNNTALLDLKCDSNLLTSLDVTNCAKLNHLDCSSNQLTTLNVTNNTSLTIFDCGSNLLTSLDISKNPVLTGLWCNSNQLTSIDVSKNTLLSTFVCYSNHFTTLNISSNDVLKILCCYSNNLRFSTIPIKQPTWNTFTYSPQEKLKPTKAIYAINEEVDTGSEYIINGQTTSYVWKTKGGTILTEGLDYNIKNGITKFYNSQPDSVFCEMTNSAFPDLVLSTWGIKVSYLNSVYGNKQTINIYPNPVKSTLYLSGIEQNTDISVLVVDIQAKEYIHKKIIYNYLDIGSLQKGVYIIIFQTKTEITSLRFIKQ